MLACQPDQQVGFSKRVPLQAIPGLGSGEGSDAGARRLKSQHRLGVQGVRRFVQGSAHSRSVRSGALELRRFAEQVRNSSSCSANLSVCRSGLLNQSVDQTPRDVPSKVVQNLLAEAVAIARALARTIARSVTFNTGQIPLGVGLGGGRRDQP